MTLRPPPTSVEGRKPAGTLALGLYRGAWALGAPAARLILSRRARRGKEDPARIGERLGVASRARPEGLLIWIHGASVGEAISVLPLVAALLHKHQRSVLVTTGTIASAKLMAERLPAGAFHQYAPIDSRAAVQSFLDHWRPDLALFVESELWPNLICETRARAMPMALVNARISEASFRGWRRAKALAHRLLSAFDVVLAQDAAVAARLTVLGAPSVYIGGSLKADAAPLPVDENALAEFMNAIYPRTVFLAASTHQGEEEALLEVATALRDHEAQALTVLVPRHPARGPQIATLAEKREFTVVRRSAGALPGADTEIYVADTMGELGLFYRTTRFVFMGGSLVPHGGQNPLEAAILDTAILTGPHTENFEEIYRTLLSAQGEGRIDNAEQLVATVLTLIANPIQTARMAGLAKAAAESLGGALGRTVDIAEKLLAAYART
jgi:3-deoxy-D-manno-octulosonic-acid transferase